MQITKLNAEKVHGYLSIDIDFFPDLTFLTGLNGSGKTSALRLLMALLTPTIEEFASINFTMASATVHDNDNDVVVRANKTSDGIEISLSNIVNPLQLSSADIQLLSEPIRNEETKPPVLEKVIKHEVFQAIRAMSTPMFLGLDRRFFAPSAIWNNEQVVRRRDYFARRLWHENPEFRRSPAAGLTDVHFLVADRVQEIRLEQERLDETLRSKLLTRAFEYKPSEIGKIDQTPKRAELERYRNLLAQIDRLAEGLRLPVPELKAALSNFFERMTTLVTALEKSVPKQEAKDKKNIAKAKTEPESAQPNIHLVEWIINKPQTDRILEHLHLLNKYGDARTALREPIDRFLSLVNGFLEQTNKRISVEANGELAVFLKGNDAPRLISALSSGERQLLVMLAHLSLNKNLIGSSVFIVDEPELSLHISWQEKFVDAIREANPSVQLIMATHSPAIILDRDDHCISLS